MKRLFRRFFAARPRLLAAGVTLALLFGDRVAAQAPAGTLVVTVRRTDSTPIFGAFVRSGRVGATTDANGVARLRLAAALRAVVVTSPGFVSRQFEMTIVAGVSQRFELLLERDAGDAHRFGGAGRLGGDGDESPVPTRVLGAAEVDQRIESHPTDLTRAIGFDWSLRAQPQAGPLDGAQFRLDGLRGQYTGVLIDGLPLLGGNPGAFGILHVSPIEFSRIELVPGAASAWYGPQAAGGVVNLVSRRPDRDQARLGINQSSEKGGDLLFFGARRQSPTVGATLTADFHQQRLVDSDDDGWGEFPRAVRFAIRPRLFVDRPNGDGLVASVGAMTEERSGGFLFTTTNADRYREQRRSGQFDAAVSATKNLAGRALLRVRLVSVFQTNSHRFDERRERDRRSTLMGDVTVTKSLGQSSVAAGIAYQRDALHQLTFSGFDLTQSMPSVFAEARIRVSDRLVLGPSGRCDRHNLHGGQCVPRLDLLVRAGRGVDLRAYGGLGYTAPTSLTDEVETLGLGSVYPLAIKAEKVTSAGVDLRLERGPWEGGLAAAFGRVALPLRLVPLTGDPAQRLRLLNIPEPTRALSITASAGVRKGQARLRGFYRFQDVTEGIPGGTGRRQADLTPRHQLGAEIDWRAPARGTEAKFEWYYVGAQPLTDDPYRTRAPAYPMSHLLVSQRSGRARIFLSAENLLDRKLRQYEQVVLVAPEAGGRVVSSPWISLRGRELSLGALVDW